MLILLSDMSISFFFVSRRSRDLPGFRSREFLGEYSKELTWEIPGPNFQGRSRKEPEYYLGENSREYLYNH